MLLRGLIVLLETISNVYLSDFYSDVSLMIATVVVLVISIVLLIVSIFALIVLQIVKKVQMNMDQSQHTVMLRKALSISKFRDIQCF